MTDALFEVETPRRNTHACTGATCHFCEWLDGKAAKDKAVNDVKMDSRWVQEAVEWRRSLEPGDLFTADDLVAAIWLPDGHPNQIGALFRQWAAAGVIRAVGYKASKRASNHARPIQVWAVRHGL